MLHGLEIEFTFLHIGIQLLSDPGLIIALFCLVCHFLPFELIDLNEVTLTVEDASFVYAHYIDDDMSDDVDVKVIV